MSSELIEAVRAGDLDKARALLAAGAAVDACDEAGRTPLMHAAHAGNLPLVVALLTAGADVNASAEGGWTAASLAVYNAEARRGFADKDRELAFDGGSGGQRFAQLGRCAAQKFFMQLGQLAGQHDLA